MGLGRFIKTLTAEYLPAYSASLTLHIKATATGASQRLGAISAIPQIPDERFSLTNLAQPKTRPPWHLSIQVPIGQANPIYLTWDNNTTPIVGGPGKEIPPGGEVLFEHGEVLLTPNTGTTYKVDALSSIQIIGANGTVFLLNYSD